MDWLASGEVADSWPEEAWAVVVAACVMGGLLVVGAVVIQRLRKHVRSPGGTSRAGFSLEQLERMRQEGGLSEEEFRLLRRSALGLDAVSAEEDNCGSSTPVGAADEECESVSADEDRADGDDEKERR